MLQVNRTFRFAPSFGGLSGAGHCGLLVLTMLGLLLGGLGGQSFAAGKGELELRAMDEKTGLPIAIRMHLKDPKGRPVKPPKVPFYQDHFILEGTVVLKLGEGTYTFEAERGPEYKIRAGSFVIEKTATDNHPIMMERFIDMAKEGWWSGDLNIRRSEADIKPLMLSEDLHIAPLQTWSIQRDGAASGDKAPATVSSAEPISFGDKRIYHLLSGSDDRAGGKLLMLQLAKPELSEKVTAEFPASTELLLKASDEKGSHFSAARPSVWDLPVWAATGKLDSVELLNSQMVRESTMLIPEMMPGKKAPTKSPKVGVAAKQENSDSDFPRDNIRYRGDLGMARFQEDVYFHLLNCGLRIAPAAGSGSGESPNPMGYNRVYVFCGEDFTWENWWQGLKQGRVMVTNGPLLLPRVKSTPALAQSDPQGELPGQVFHTDAGGSLELLVSLNLSTRDKIEYLELIKDGKVIEEVRLDKWAQAGGKLPPVPFTESGWLMIRAVASNTTTYRAAYAGPYYVEVGYKPRISKASAQFFLDWVTERAKKVNVADKEQRDAVLVPLRTARDFWKAKIEAANAP